MRIFMTKPGGLPSATFFLFLSASLTLTGCRHDDNSTAAAVNSAPVANAVSLTTDEDTTGNLILLGTDDDGDALTVEVITAPVNGSLNVSSGNAPLAAVYTPNTDFNGSDSFTYEVNDGQASSVPVTVNLTINAVNDAPVLTAMSDQSARVGKAYQTSITATDVENDSITYTSVGTALPGWATLNASTGEISGMPNAAESITGLQISVSDGTDSVLSNTFTLSVTEPFYQAPPVDLIVSSTGCPATTSAANLSWTAVDGAEEYDITVAAGPAFDTWNVVTSTANTSYSWSSGSNGIAYKFQITPTASVGSFDAVQTIAPYTHAAAVYYINVAQADDSGDGCTPVTAKQTLAAARTLGNANALHDYYLMASGAYPAEIFSTNANGFYLQGGFDSSFATRGLSDGDDTNGIEGSVLTQPGSCHTCNPLNVTNGSETNTSLNILDGMTLRVTGHVDNGLQAGLFASSAMTIINNDIDGGTPAAAASSGGVWGIYASNFAADLIVHNNRIVFGTSNGGRTSLGIDTQSGHLPSEIVGNKFIGAAQCGTAARPMQAIEAFRPGNHRPTALIADNLFEIGTATACVDTQGYHQAIMVQNGGSGYINLTIRGNTIRYFNRNAYSNAILLGSAHAVIDGNTIDMGDHSAGGVSAIQLSAGNDANITASITNNLVTWGNVQNSNVVNAAIYPFDYKAGNVQISNNTIVTGTVTALNNSDPWNVGIRLYQGDADAHSVSNNIIAIGDAVLGVVAGGTARRYAIEEVNGAGKAGSIENNAFVDMAGTDTALIYLQNAAPVTSVAALNAQGTSKDGNIMLDALSFVDPASDYRLQQNSLTDQTWWNLTYGGKDTSMSICHASGSLSCGNVVNDITKAARTALIGSNVPDNTDAAGVSMGAIEY